MANDDDKKNDDERTSKPDLSEASPSEQVAQAAAEEAVAEMKLAEAKAEAKPKDRKLKAEVAAAKAAEAKADAEKASEHADELDDDGAKAGAEMTKAQASKTRGEALEEAAAAESESEPPPPAEEVVAPAAAARTSDVPGEADEVPPTRPALFLAQYETVDDLVHAAEQVRDAGYEKWDCHTPYPVHGLDQAMGLRETKIGYISFVCGMVGLVSAVLMIQFMNNWDYPIVIGGKPPGAFPAMVPIMFELTVLLTGFGTLFGLLHLCRLPRHHHPIFESDRFEAATDDRYFISIETEDPKFDVSKTRVLLERTHPSHLELVEEEIA